MTTYPFTTHSPCGELYYDGGIRGVFNNLPTPIRSRQVTSWEEFEKVCDSFQIVGLRNRPRKELVQFLLSPVPPPIIGRKVEWSILPDGTYDKLYEYQRETIETIVLQLNGRCLIAAPMGRGKTAMASIVAALYGHEDILILAIKTTLGAWKRELLKWGGLNGTISTGGKGERYPITIMTYESARVNPEIYEHVWKTVIFDESHTIKNPETITCKRLLGLGIRARCCLMLSATPRQKCSSELYCQILPLLGGKKLGSWDEFITRYCGAKMEKRFGKMQQVMTEQRFKGELNCLLTRCMIRLAPTDDEVNLPPFKRIMVEFEIENSEALDELKKIQEEYDMTDEKDERAKLSRKLWRQTGIAKVPYCEKWLFNWLNTHPGEKIGIYTNSLNVLTCYEEFLKSLNISCARIDGSVKTDIREDLIKSLCDLENHEYRVGLFTYGTCAYGVTFSPGMYNVLMFEMDDTPTIVEQSEGKFHRLGAKFPVNSYWFIAKNSYDTSMLPSMQRKTDGNSQVVDGKRRKLLFDHK